GKIGYGGGGIIPDDFVPLDTSAQNETLNYIKRRGYVSNFVFEELDKDRKLYENMSASDFIENFNIDDAVVEKFQDFLNLKERTSISFVNYYEQMKTLIKSELASQLFNSTISEQIINESDTVIEEVIVLSKTQEALNEE
ncbi:MAG: peptidase S41, partial [Algicola sp.]|nr:peptidase S41 [Algicola sp.]